MPSKNATAKRGVVLIIGVILLAVVGAFLIPQIIDGETETRIEALEMTEGEVIQITSTLEATAVTIDGNPDDEVNVTIVDQSTGDSVNTGAITEGNSQDVTLSGETITVTNNLVSSNSLASISFEYPVDFAWGTPTTQIYSVIGVLLIAMIILYSLIAGFAIMGDSKR
jgi:hypothetical protein